MSQLVRKAQRGDKEAFISLMEEQKQAMYKVAVGILKNDADAADAMQDTVLSCFENLQSLREPRYFKTWMTRILINHCNRILGERKKLIPMEEYFSGQVKEKAGQPQGIKRATMNEDFLKILDRIEDKYRIIILLYYVEEFSVREISQILEMNENTVKTRLARGRGIFKKVYMKEHPDFRYQTGEI